MASVEIIEECVPAEQFISEEDLKETERLLKHLVRLHPKSASHYKAWMEQRQKSIEAIGRLEKKLENLHWACNTVNGVGSAMEAVGGLAMVAGAILSACGHESTGDFLTKKVSPVTMATGVATSMSSSMADMGLTHMIMQEVKMVLKQDEAYTKLLVENLEYSKKIDSYIRRIFNCSILSDTFENVVQLCDEGISSLDVAISETSKLDEVLAELKCKSSKDGDILLGIGTATQNVYATMKKMSSNPKLRKALRNICDIIQQSPLAIEFIKLGLRISFRICDIPSMDIFTSLLGFGALKAIVGAKAAKCLLGTILIAVNVLSVISAVQNAKEGTSKYSTILKKLNQALTMELNVIRRNQTMLL